MEKRIVIALTYVHGIGSTTAKKILDSLKIDHSVRVKDMTEDELNKIRDHVANMTVEGDLQRLVGSNITRLKETGTYRGQRHKSGLPVRGQRTRTNGRTKRGKRVAVGGAQPKAATKT